MTITPKNLYTTMAWAEMATWTALIAAMVARYGFGYQGELFFVAGLSHGIIFLAYCIVAIVIGVNLRWGFGTITFAVLFAIPPWLTIPFDRWLHTKNKLEQNWQLEATESQGLFYRFVQWWLARPVGFLVVMVIGMALVVMGLLNLGSPTQWGSS
jgi:integral membrane protein